jgi:hypothetical protein
MWFEGRWEVEREPSLFEVERGRLHVGLAEGRRDKAVDTSHQLIGPQHPGRMQYWGVGR